MIDGAHTGYGLSALGMVGIITSPFYTYNIINEEFKFNIMIIFALFLFGASMFLAQFPKLMLGNYRDQIVGLETVLETAPHYDQLGIKLIVALVPFGAFFFSIVIFGAIPNWQPVVLVSPAFSALTSGIINWYFGVVNLSRTHFFSDKYFVGDIATRLSLMQILLAIVLIGLAVLLRGAIGAIRL